jgi:hypothetical protein
MGTNTALPIFAYYTKYINADDSLHISQEDFEVPETVIVSPLDCEKSPSNSSDIDNQDNLDDWGLQDDNW